MDTRVGLDYIMDNKDYTHKLVAALGTDDILVKKQVFELLSALCVYRSDGYIRALETLEHYKSSKKRRYRLQVVVDELKSSEVAEYSTALVAFLNCLVISPASLGERVGVRNELLGLKILEVLNRFRKQCKDGSHSDLAVQLDVFDEQRAADEGQFAGPEGVDLSSHMDVFFAILRQIAETPQEVPFLSILQHLLRTELSQPLSELIWETAEILVHRATLLENKQEADRLLRASNSGGLRCHCSCHYRQNSLVSEDCEITSGKKSKPNQLSLFPAEGARTPTTSPSPSHPFAPCNLLSSPLPSWHTSRYPREAPLQRHLALNPGPPEVQETPSDEDTAGENVPITQNANTQCDVGSNKTALASDVFSSDPNSRACTVDASVGFENCSNGVRVLPKMSNVPPPPPPPLPIRSGRAPPPLSLLRTHIPPQANHRTTDLTLPQTDIPKPKAKMKSFNWSKIPASKVIGKDNLWSRIAKENTGSSSDLDFKAMEMLFCQQPVSTSGRASPRFGDPIDAPEKKRKEVQEINLLDGKRSLNINIFLKQFRSSNENIVRILEEGAHQDLGAERLRGLLKILPESDEVDLLKNFDGDKIKLGSAEKFLLQLIEVPSYKLRVESMLLKEEFLANQDFLENSIETIRSAAQELEECGKLHEVLYRILVAGNFLNAGGYAGNAAGFKLLSLLKLADIRSNRPSVTLIHYVAEEVSKKRPDLLEFPDLIHNLEEASKISMETLQTDISSLCQRVSKVSTHLTAADDQIKAQMQDFMEFARRKLETLQNEMDELEGVRQRMADFLCEDSGVFKLEDCFRVFRSFCARFKAAAQENERRQKQEQLVEARKKQREQQIALKRRSLELPGARSDTDPIIDELLDDIRDGFPETRLGRRIPDDRLKRHSDPAMLEKCGDDRLSCNRNRRARFLDAAGFSQNMGGDSSGREEDIPERVSFRRSGRRKRVGMESNGDSQSRERSSPPPQATLQSREPEMDSKQRLRLKINDWMLQNEKEQNREKDLQLKLLQERKKRLPCAENILEEIEESDLKQVTIKPNSNSGILKINSLLDDNFKITKNASSGQSDSFTQKIIGLIDATTDESKMVAKSRLCSCTREVGAVGEEPGNKSKDDSHICSKHGRQASSSEDASEKPDSKLDRFAPTRKTRRRLKLREMRIEAENIKALRQEKKSTDTDAFTPDSSIPTENSSLMQHEISEVDVGSSLNLDDGSDVTTLERRDLSANAIETDGECAVSHSRQTQEVPETKEPCANETETKEVGTMFSRQKNASLRSRQSRLARRIHSLTLPVASPDSAGSSAVGSESEECRSKSADSELTVQGNDGDHKQSEKVIGSVPIDDKTSQKSNHAQNKGLVSHKVTVSTETKSKVMISKPIENSSTKPSLKSRVPLQKAVTSIPEVVRTTRNVRVQQTTQREGPINCRTITQKAEISRKIQSKPPTQLETKHPATAQFSKQPGLCYSTSTEAHASKNGSLASSTWCNMNTSVGLKTEKRGAKKIRIQHNGSVDFMKNASGTKPASNLKSTPKIEKNEKTPGRAS